MAITRIKFPDHRHITNIALDSGKMGLGKKKRRPSQLSLLQAEAEAAQISPFPSPDISPRSSLQSTPSPDGHSSVDPTESAPEHQLPSPALTPPTTTEQAESPLDAVPGESRPDDLLDPALIGRTIKLVREDDWSQ